MFYKIKQLNVEEISYRVTPLAFLGILFFSFYYIYLLNDSVFNVVLREKYSKEARLLGSEVSLLENKFIEVRNNINIDMAYSLGYRDDFNNIHFSSEDKNLSGGLSLLGNEIR